MCNSDHWNKDFSFELKSEGEVNRVTLPHRQFVDAQYISALLDGYLICTLEFRTVNRQDFDLHLEFQLRFSYLLSACDSGHILNSGIHSTAQGGW